MTRCRLIVLCLIWFSASGICVAESQTSLPENLKAQADSLYSAQKYEESVALYEQLLKGGQSSSVLYNLGNAYYRLHDLGHAILNYERATMLSPGDRDVRFNLSLARSKTVDKIESSDDFFIYGFKSVINRYSSDSWGHICIGAFVLMCVCFIVYRFSSRLLLRKIGFFAALLFLLVVILGNIFAYAQVKNASGGTAAIVMNVSDVKSSPSVSGSTLFKLHEGTKVSILDNSMKQWAKIELADGKTGWIFKKQIESI